MVKIWAKTVKDHHITSQQTYLAVEKYDTSRFFTYLTDCCQLLDVSVPVVLDVHVKNFEKFHHVKFRPADFVDRVDFDYLLLEDVT